VLGPFAGKVGVHAGDPLFEAGFRRQELLPVKAPLDLLGLECVAVRGHHPQLLAESGNVGGRRRQLALRCFAPLPGLIAIVGDLVALLLDPVDRLPQFRQRRVDGLQLLAGPPVLVLERLPLARPLAAGLLVGGQFG